MREPDPNDLWSLVQRPMTPDERLLVVPLVIERAREARARALCELLGSPFRLAARAIAVAWRAGGRWRKRRQATRELRARDDRTLRDLGSGRPQIETAIRGTRPERFVPAERRKRGHNGLPDAARRRADALC